MLSGYRLMWLIVMFDLPVTTKPERKAASDFRLALLNMGFLRSQYSVYAKFCSSHEQVQTNSRLVRKALPPKGSVNLLTITDTQFRKIICYQERKNISEKNLPKQLELF